jgi:outer membrane protein TolC
MSGQSRGIEISFGLITLTINLEFLIRATVAVVLASGSAAISLAQQPDAPAPQPIAVPQNTHGHAANAPPTGAPVKLTLQDAIALARKNEPTYRSAVTDAGIAREDRVQARDALLPTAQFVTSDLYTQPNNSAYRVRYIANNAPHEYVSQGNVHEQLDVGAFASYRRSAALAAAAKAQAEIASRGLVVTVMGAYFGVAAAEQKVAIAKRISDEGDQFLQLTKDLESGGEVAHSDVIKAELQTEDRHRQYSEAQLARLNARLDLSVLVFPDSNDNFELADDLHANIALPPRGEFEAQAAHENPEIRAALAVVQAANQDVTTARAGYLPTISLDYWYGIDAERYATYTPATPPEVGRFPNLGTSALASLTLPLWNWGATQSRVRQAEMRRDQTKVELSYAQRKLLAEMRSLYSEAETSLNELAGLQRASQLAEDSLKLTTLRYKNGEATVLEVVDAQTTYAAANGNYQDGAVRYRVALANLQTLTGVLTAP